MPTITFQPEAGEAVSIAASPGENLLELARKANVPIDAPCSGNGSCGKCRVRLLQGVLASRPTLHVPDDDYADGWRLACASTVADGDATILAPDIASAYRSRLRVTDLSSPEEMAAFNDAKKQLEEAGFCNKTSIFCLAIGLEPPTLEDTLPDNERLLRAIVAATGAENVTLPFPVLQKLPDALREGGFGVACVLERTPDGLEILDLQPSRLDLAGSGASSDALPLEVLASLPSTDAVGAHGDEISQDERNHKVGDGATPDGNPSGTVEAGDLNGSVNAVPRICGLAVDVGTTTVSALLVDLSTGDVLAKAGAGNGQIRYGADVIHRIMEQERPGGRAKLQEAIVEETLNPLIDSLCQAGGVVCENIYRMAVAGNTTMEHLLLGVPASGVRMEPYVPAFFEIDPPRTESIGVRLGAGARLHLSPNVGSYVGGDISAGVLASLVWNRSELQMLIDLGTNGEIVVGNDEFLVSCACSAGPAFEGGDIGCGMRATDGAVEACKLDRATLAPTLSVIGGGKPVGVCGSGLIDLVAELLAAGAIDGRGKFVDGGRGGGGGEDGCGIGRDGGRVRRDEFDMGRYVLAFANESATGREVAITEVDIDNFIRAKGAIFSALMTLLESLGFAPSDIQKIFVAGGIGGGIDIPNAIRVGMFPPLPVERYSYIGNASLIGAYAMLVSDDAEEKLREVARAMTYMELSAQPGYMDAFVAACFLPHTDASLFR
ncbi:MAG: ASKHA domain-containing protein [Acidobacteriota bacterium]|jgi:uncharacterized 2Fe-2S/4Fe-4S cluster protein (DUF4445 family)|nr:ASKHA domain-containing protein [Acidobacteriota bacterium]